MILCDTNILIEIYKGNIDIIESIEHIGQENIVISHITCAELLYGARNKTELKVIRKDINKLTVVPIESAISVIAIGLVEKYSLSHRLNLPDAFIAATAIYHELTLYTLNLKDFVYIQDIKLHKVPEK